MGQKIQADKVEESTLVTPADIILYIKKNNKKKALKYELKPGSRPQN
jgi:pyridoxal biosynthesis lyase PdxS